MAKLSNFDFFVYGAVAALGVGFDGPYRVEMSKIYHSAGAKLQRENDERYHLAVINSLIKLRKNGVMNWISIDEGVVFDLSPIFLEDIGGAA